MANDIIRARVRTMSDDELRSEYVAACRQDREHDIVAMRIRHECVVAAQDRGLPLREQTQRKAQLVLELFR